MRFFQITGPLLVAPLVVLAACGGNSADDGRDIDEQELALLQRMALTLEDLPAGLEQAAANVATNEDLAQGAVDPQAERERLDALGRRLSYDLQFLPVSTAPPDLTVRAIQNVVSLYATADGAATALDEAIAQARQTDWVGLHGDLADVQFQEVERHDLAPHHAWFRVSGLDDQGSIVIDDQMVFRVGGVRVFLRVASLHPPGQPREVFVDEVAGWATIVAERIEQVLAGGDPAPSPAS